ncbi:MAG: bifunctional folylpolyglutamate synthase/dihydrofolate synthase [Prevotellaceae bacterium]|jgi:dihydrofolate synthase/folylpolyglutamate synthase|nr:bifunctional folylpolyglutamate synthase/dihydrofolate synthase [Prevotellaceae bacterium]
MNYKETVQYLYDTLPVFHRTGKSAYKTGLDNSLALDNYFGNPHASYRTIHVAGTNGKGSVSHMIASALMAAGYRTGLYTSPHLFDFRERIRIDGNEIDEQSVIDFIEKNKSIIETLKPSFFEITSAMALKLFGEKNVDVAVIETGLGGRLDSTNIITPCLSVITNIGFDHVELLGNTLEKIALEKAGIIKPCISVTVGERDENIDNVFINAAAKNNSPLFFAEDCFEIRSVEKHSGQQVFDIEIKNCSMELSECKYLRLSLDLEGEYQKKNIITALTAVAIMCKNGFNINIEAIVGGFAKTGLSTGLKGRWQILNHNPTVVCDTGHNAHGLALTMRQLSKIKCDNLFFVLGVVSDKDLSTIIPLLPQKAYYFYTQASIPRAMDAHVLAQECSNAGLSGEVATPVCLAVNKAFANALSNDVVFIGGSTYTVAEAGNTDFQ